MDELDIVDTVVAATDAGAGAAEIGAVLVLAASVEQRLPKQDQPEKHQ